MSNCPFCQHPGAYDSGFTVECANTKCSRFSQRQLEEFSGPTKSASRRSPVEEAIKDNATRATSYVSWSRCRAFDQTIRYTGPIPVPKKLGVWMGPVERVGKIPPRQEMIPIWSDGVQRRYVPQPPDVSEPREPRVAFEQRVRRLSKERALAALEGRPMPPLPYDIEVTQTSPTTVVFRQKSCLEILEELRQRGHRVSDRTWLAAVDDIDDDHPFDVTVEF